MPVIQKPKDETVPPTVLPEDDKDRPIDSKPVPIDEDVVTPPKPVPQPVPVSPIYEQPQENKTVDFSFYGTACKVRYNDKAKFTLDGSDNEQLAEAWNNLSTNACNNTIRDCLELRIRLQLSDWAYPNMLDSFVRKVFGDTNEATLFMAYIYCQSGYKMRLALADGRLCMLIAGKHAIYDTGYFNIDGENFYPFNCKADNMRICDAEFPEEKPLSLLLPTAQNFAYNGSGSRKLASNATRHGKQDGEGDTANKRLKKGMQDLMFEIMTIL